MKLSKYVSISLTSASVVVYGFGVIATQAHAQSLLSDDVSAQIEASLGQADDSDQLLVDSLSQVESELSSLGVSDFSSQTDDPTDVAELKDLRMSYIQQLRERLSNLSGEERLEFIAKIRARRKEVRQKLVEIRKTNKEELNKRRDLFKQRVQDEREQLKDRMQTARQEKQDSIQAAREKFKENVEDYKQRLQDRKMDAKDKLKTRIETRKSLEPDNPAMKAVEIRNQNVDRQRVQGAVDYQPQGLFEYIGYLIGR